ncbi:MAG: hypothetical protein HY720_02380 [Planctomycetes bacterium]|nr:hypothetical protein [Planctomycetota bacterium]
MTPIRTTALATLLVLWPLAVAAFSQEEMTEDERKILYALETTEITLDVVETPIEDVFDYLRQAAGINIVLDPSVLQDVDPARRRCTISLRRLPAIQALRLLLDLHGLSAAVKNGVLFIAAKDSLDPVTYTRSYDIRDILFEIRDFPGPDISLADANAQGNNLGAVIFEPPPDRQPPVTGDEIVDIVRENTSPESWIEGKTALSIVSGHLVVRQTREVHREVQKLLAMLRAHK